MVSLDNFWDHSFDLVKPISPEIISRSANVVVQEKTTMIGECPIFYLEVVPNEDSKKSTTIVLLHGENSSSELWLKLQTIQILGAAGYRVLAIDLPGYGNSGDEGSISCKPCSLRFLLLNLEVFKPVVVSPGISGLYSLSVAINYWKMLAGFVPVSLSGEFVVFNPHYDGNAYINRLPDYFKSLIKDPIPDLHDIKIPTLVVYGEHYRSLSSAIFSLLPFAGHFEIPGGDDKPHIFDPEIWNTLLLNFVSRVNRTFNLIYEPHPQCLHNAELNRVCFEKRG